MRPPGSRIQRSVEFKAVYENGHRLSGPLFAAFCLPHRAEERSTARLGLTVPRAIGGAVVRNRIKRRFRELFRVHRSELGPQWDIVINPRKAAVDASFEQIERSFRKVIEKCGP
ncbi:MAG: ribonuclease P protein component [Bryobacteraceae bacterium]